VQTLIVRAQNSNNETADFNVFLKSGAAALSKNRNRKKGPIRAARGGALVI